nr:MAG TPA: hypothetical protein [Caudoviricetes sp.]
MLGLAVDMIVLSRIRGYSTIFCCFSKIASPLEY